MPRPPKPWYSHGAWYTDFGRRNRLLVRGPKDEATRLLAEKALLQLREEAQVLVRTKGGADTPFAVIVERFLDAYAGRPVYADFSNELHWFMGADAAPKSQVDGPRTDRGQDRPSGGRFGVPCKAWPIRRINAQLVEQYLRRRRAAGLSGYHAFVTLRTLMNWAKRKGYIPNHDLDAVDPALRRKGRRRYLPADQDVVRIFQGATGRFKELLLVYMLTGIRPSELRTVLIDEFDRPNRQWVLWRHKVVERTGMPKVVPLATDELVAICVAAAGDRPVDQPLFLNSHGKPWTYNALRLRWYRLRAKVGLDARFKLYSLRHWYLTMAVEAGEDGAIVSELAGHVDRASLDFYKKVRSQRLHQASRRVAETIARVGIAGARGPSEPE